MSENNNNKKICSRCKVLKPYSEFFKDKHNKKYGLSGYCKTCKVAYQKGLRNKDKPTNNKVDAAKTKAIIKDQIILSATGGLKNK